MLGYVEINSLFVLTATVYRFVAPLLWACIACVPVAAMVGGDVLAASGRPEMTNSPDHAASASGMSRNHRIGDESAGVADPILLAEWLDTLTEPRYMTALAAAWMDPGERAGDLFNRIDPAAMRNSAEFTDPLLFLRWVMMSGQPSLQRAVLERSGNPDTRQWHGGGLGVLGIPMSPSSATPGIAADAEKPGVTSGRRAQPGTLVQTQPLQAWPGTLLPCYRGAAEHLDWLRLPAAAGRVASPSFRY